MARQKGGRKRKKKRDDGEQEVESAAESDFSEGSSSVEETESQKYKDFRIADYTRHYPEEGGNFEYIVFLESKNEHPIGTRDMMSLANCLKRYNKGIKQLQRINKYKIGVVFERSGLANAALKNKSFLESYELMASIPASASEVTGVITHVPIELSNSQIYAALTTTKNIVCIRRFMRKTRMDNGQVKMEPTKTVSITFSCPVLPESVDLNSWRFVLRPYIPPVMQCLKCLRYGHIAKFCKNSERCSICGDAHNFKLCTVPKEEARCIQCKGPHVAISPECPEPMVIAGDFNARHTAWGCATIDARGRDVIESINDNGLVVLNDGQSTTVGSSTWQRNALDLTLVSPSLAFSCEWSVCDDPMGSYHLPSNQFGFRRGKSSRESISHLQLEIFDALKQDNVLVGVFFDVVGAFNNVNHHILAQELFSLGVPYLKTGHGVKLPKQMSIFSAEGLAIFAALQFVEEKVQESKHWIVLTDSMSCLKALQSNKFDSGLNYILYDIRKLYFKLTGNGIDIILMWVPSHSGVSGNENADKLARIISSSSNLDNDTVDSRNVATPFTDFIPKFKLQLKQNWLTDWEESLRVKGKWYNKINNNICRPWFTNSPEYFSRKFYNTIMRLRFGHCRFNSHLYRMQIISSPLCTSCNLGAEQTLNHIFFECHAHNIQRLVLADRLLIIYKTSDSIPRDIQDILTNPVTYKDIYNFIISSELEL